MNEGYCDMRGFLSFMILFLLSKNNMSGKKLADEFEKRKGSRPSPGTIYPALKCLKEAGLIKESKKGKTINYSLTDHGKKEFKKAKLQFCKIFMDVI
ncbi:MAG: PadR family transcriptional regulator [Candidatus Diapherotrites archaeon]|nr:PadR family transcriptional regulator [Candidatus Diapherotrites archaeon]